MKRNGQTKSSGTVDPATAAADLRAKLDKQNRLIDTNADGGRLARSMRRLNEAKKGNRSKGA